MKTIRLSDEVYRRIETLVMLVFRTTGERQPDGTWIVPVADRVRAELRRERRPDESDEDTLVRLIEDAAAQLRRNRMI